MAHFLNVKISLEKKMRLDNLPVSSLTKIAWALNDAHGEGALDIARQTIGELELEGHLIAADAWRSVECLLEDVQLGRIDRNPPIIH